MTVPECLTLCHLNVGNNKKGPGFRFSVWLFWRDKEIVWYWKWWSFGEKAWDRPCRAMGYSWGVPSETH